MILDIFAGIIAWALLCLFFVAVLTASGRQARSTPLSSGTKPTLVPAISRRPLPPGTAAFTLDLDPYGLDRQLRRLVSASTTSSK